MSRQGFYKRLKATKDKELVSALLVDYVKDLRVEQRKLGCVKIYDAFKAEMHQFAPNVGRDKFLSIMRENRLLIKKRRKYAVTTNSFHKFRKYKNLIKDMEITAPEQLWVSDITYIRTDHGFGYLSLITDHYSKKIMGYCLFPTLSTKGPLEALKMALKNRVYKDRELMHHSDRGFQYCSDEYVKILGDDHIKISMTENSDPYENAVAERVNGILKSEFDIDQGFVNNAQAAKEIKRVVEIYNNKRPHMSCMLMTPNKAHLFGKFKMKSYKRILTKTDLSTKKKKQKENLQQLK
jgi:transposase InsO family protein